MRNVSCGSGRRRPRVAGGGGMRSLVRRLLLIGCVIGSALWLVEPVALASPTPTPVQPGSAPLTAVTFTTAGNIGSAGGLTYTFSGLASSVMAQFTDLEWGPQDSSSVKLGLDGTDTNPGETLTFNAADSNL